VSDWLEELLRRARQRKPLVCAGCGRTWDRADMLEATMPSLFVRGDEHFRMSFTLSSVELVGRGFWWAARCGACQPF
jgi:hypothetical protein